MLVTGAAGFIGSNLSRELLKNYNVFGVDNFHEYYEKPLKKANLRTISGSNEFLFEERDITNFGDVESLPNFEAVFHLAAQPGVRDSWDNGFRSYAINNVLGTQQVLELATKTGAKRFIYSSSSSVYGDSIKSPAKELDHLSPISPYGVSKLTGELLANAYAQAYDLKVRSLRYFTVYGPSQRPDMAINRVINCTINNKVFTQYGDGSQSRDFTYIDDVVNANILAFETPQENPSQVFNVGGGEEISLLGLIREVEEIAGSKLKVNREHVSKGDVRTTKADISSIKAELGWIPKVSLKEGLKSQVEWQKIHSENRKVQGE